MSNLMQQALRKVVCENNDVEDLRIDHGTDGYNVAGQRGELYANILSGLDRDGAIQLKSLLESVDITMNYTTIMRIIDAHIQVIRRESLKRDVVS